LRECELHSEDICLQAQLEYHEQHSPRKNTWAHLAVPTGIQPIILTTPALNAPSIPESQAMRPLPTLLIPETASSGSSSLYTRDSLSISLALSAVSLPSQLGKRSHLNYSGLHRSVSGSLPPLSPIVLGQTLHGFSDQPWSTSDQADWEIGLARLTVSAGLPLRWFENHEWKVLCDRFLPRAKIPSAKVLTQRVMPHTLNTLETIAKDECRGANATLQCDGWTGENLITTFWAS
jgi:hypothetical protein